MRELVKKYEKAMEEVLGVTSMKDVKVSELETTLDVKVRETKEEIRKTIGMIKELNVGKGYVKLKSRDRKVLEKIRVGQP